jgi:hypothetical protein
MLAPMSLVADIDDEKEGKNKWGCMEAVPSI